MAAVGSAALSVALLTALYAVGAGVRAGVSRSRPAATSARRAIYCLAALMVLALVILEAAYLRTDLSFALVAQNSSIQTPTFYKVTAMWSSQAGSLMLWVLLLSLFSSAVLYSTRASLREVTPYATAVLGAVAAFFLSLMVLSPEAQPFATLVNPPIDGQGLNPLLRHPAMMFHPPMLYTGYVGFTIPFAFAIGALITRRTGAEWIRATRRFALIAWTFLGFGILLGALWSYSELGWGGYWAWDPVENASLMPWLTGTAFLHSIMIQERRGMLKVWNVSLIVATFVLALLGTFLVRSGILNSIHAFGESTLGAPFLGFIAFVLIGSVALVLSRRESLRSKASFDSLASREAIFLLNNLVLVSLCVVIFYGTFFPLISSALTGAEASVGPPWFNAFVAPLAIVLVLLAGIGPVIAWRRATPANLRRSFRIPAVAMAVTFVVLVMLTPAASSPTSLIVFSFIAFTIVVALQEVWRGVGARRVMAKESWPVALSGLISHNRHRYGGYVVHVGIATLMLGVAGSSAFVGQRDARLSPGESISVDGYTVTYREPTAELLADRSGTGAPVTLGAVLDVNRAGRTFTLHPSRNYYPSGDPAAGAIGRFFDGEATSEVDLRWGLARDLWTAVQPDLQALRPSIDEADRRFVDASAPIQAAILREIVESYRSEPPPATFRVIVSPLAAWIWLGGAIVMAGALIALWPAAGARRRLSSVEAARLGRELSRA
ncbi:MAG: heme lyase CcmF/NrfE family subunit [Thermoleophilaceae bacterium]|nr:heme lyase CcmF/NrfE family subunit [Thermoleophilaceae bacterium]